MPDRTPKKKKKKWPIVVIVISAIVIIAVAASVGIFQHYYGLTQFEGGDETNTSVSQNNSVPDNADSTGLTDSEAKSLKEEKEKEAANADVTLPDDSNVYNLLLVGVDRRDTSWNGNSDSMILLSINKSTKRITMMSFMRDLYANIEGHGVRKLNAACAYGGCPLLVQTIEQNYKVHIDNYVWVDFTSMVQIVDAVGGIDLTISDDEAKVANSYIQEMCNLLHKDYASEQISKGGDLHCDGIQAVAYGRIRYVGNSDYQRTERQRTIMTKIIQKARNMSLGELNSFASTVLPLVHHNISAGTVLSLTTSAPAILKYDVVQSRVPYDGHFTVKKEILNPDMTYTISKIQEELYG